MGSKKMRDGLIGTVNLTFDCCDTCYYDDGVCELSDLEYNLRVEDEEVYCLDYEDESYWWFSR